MARYRFASVRNHPLQPSPEWKSVPVHRLVLWDTIGYGPHLCHWCGGPINWKPGGRTKPGVLTVDHVDKDDRNNDPSNLVPSCHPCNCRRDHPQNVSDDEPFVIFQGVRHRAVLRVCLWCDEEFPHLAADHRPNRGLFCSRSHARSWEAAQRHR